MTQNNPEKAELRPNPHKRSAAILKFAEQMLDFCENPNSEQNAVRTGKLQVMNQELLKN